MHKWLKRNFRFLRHRLMSIVVVAVLSAASIACILASFIWQEAPWSPLVQDIGTNLIGAVAAFVAFDVILSKIEEVTIRERNRLDQRSFINHIHEAKSRVRILETWTLLFDERSPGIDFDDALKSALKDEVKVEILLLHPDSPLVDKRSRELGGRCDVKRNILNNLRRLQQVVDDLDPMVRTRLHIRLYDVPYSIALYECDGRAYTSFFTLDRLSNEGSQLELSMTTPLGHFLEERFTEVWNDNATQDVTLYMFSEMKIIDSQHQENKFPVKWILHNNVHYVSDANLLEYLGNTGAEHVQASIERAPGMFRLKTVRRDQVERRVADLFEDKYGRCEQVVAQLTPIAQLMPVADTLD